MLNKDKNKLTMKQAIFSFIVFLLLIYTKNEARANSAAVSLVQVLDQNGQIIRKGTAFFTNGQGMAISHKELFKDAVKARITTSDSTVHNVVKIVGISNTTGLVKFVIDNNLTTTFKFLELSKSDFKPQGTIHSFKSTEPKKVDKTIESILTTRVVEGYGEVVFLNGKKDGTFVGAPLTDGSGKVIGVIVPGVTDKGTLVVQAENIEFQNVSITPSALSGKAKEELAYLKAITAVAEEDFTNAKMYLQRAKSIMPNEEKIPLLEANIKYDEDDFKRHVPCL